MKIIEKSFDQIKSEISEYHILTYAEEGFSPLNIYTKNLAIKKESLIEYAEMSNNLDQIVTIDNCNLSVLPRRIVRGRTNIEEIYNMLKDFFILNDKVIFASKFLFDFGVPKVSDDMKTAISKLANLESLIDVKEIVIVV